jgi:GNAT superfamily N-acetyltransferase
MDGDLVIREAAPADAEAILAIGRELVEDGDTFVFAPTTSDDELKAYWLSPAGHTFVAVLDGRTVGCYFLRSNYPGRGRHVGNVSYAVSRGFTRRGIGRAMAEHSLEMARGLGFQAMLFDHPSRGLVDAYVMHKFL